MSRIAHFKQRLKSGELMVGSFLKTPSPIVCEVLGLTRLDAICIDAEHAPFGPPEIDACIAALRAADMPVFVRPQTATAGAILGALDSGANGLVLPHIFAPSPALALANAAFYKTPTYPDGSRGYAGSSRAARYTTKSMAEHMQDSNALTTVIAQIEDAQALAQIDAIAAIGPIDCLFVGRMDLTVSLGATAPTDTVVIDAVQAICAAARKHNKPVGMFIPPGETIAQWRESGASLFLLGSDQQFLLDGAHALRRRVDGAA